MAPLPVEQRFATDFDLWAIVVGISAYRDEGLNLAWARRDAEKLAELIQTPSGGGFKPEHIRLLVDAQATTAAITSALRSFLQKPKPEDMVLLYFACHGSPDPVRPNVTYLYTHDTDRKNVSGTALPMREINMSLQENLAAEKVVIIADTCHSASIADVDGVRGGGNDAEVVNTYLEKVSRAHGGVALLTSARANETAREDERWDGGHGVFTHFLLRGLQGEADGYRRPKDGIVSVGELFEYVRDNVQRETDDQQHPVIGPALFDADLPMAVSGGVDAREHVELARRLLVLGHRLDERDRYLAAAREYSAAIRLSRLAGAALPEAMLGLGRALLAADDAAGCVAAVQPLIADPLPAGGEEALLLRGVGRAKLGDVQGAKASLEQFVAASPEHEYADFARSYLTRPQQGPGHRFALLIGIDEYSYPNLANLSGCVNDVAIMERVLSSLAGADPDETVVLTNASATRAGIAAAFANLAERAAPTDTVLVQFSGHSLPDSVQNRAERGDLYLFMHDTVDAGSGVSASELHAWLQAIRSRHTTIVLDTHPHRAFLELAEREGDYRVLLASDSAQMAFETSVEFDGRLVTAGSFTTALAGELQESDPVTLTFGGLLDGVIRRLAVGGPQPESPADPDVAPSEISSLIPVLIGDRDDLVFGESDIHLWAFDFALRRTYPRETVERLRARRRRVPRGLTDALPSIEVSFARAFIERGAIEDARSVLETVATRDGPHAIEAVRLLAAAQLGGSRLRDAPTTLRVLADRIERADLRAALTEQAAQLEHTRRRALLVGIELYENGELAGVKGALNDVRLIRKALQEHCGFADDDITVLQNRKATRAAIVESFRQLADAARTEPALFYFAGNGSNDRDGIPTLVSTDGRLGEVYDIRVDELASMAKAADAANLVSIVDASFIRYLGAGGYRSVPTDLRERRPDRQRGFFDTALSGLVSVVSRLVPSLSLGKRDLAVSQLRIGSVTIYDRQAIEVSWRVAQGNLPTDPKPGAQGSLTRQLTRALTRGNAHSYRGWVESARAESVSDPLVFAEEELLDEPVFENHRVRESARTVLRKLDAEPIAEAVTILRRLIDEREKRGDWDPAGRLDLGIAWAAAGDHAASIDVLERAVSLYRDPTIMMREREHDPRADARLREAHYQLGRVLYESGTDFTKAVSELDKAAAMDPHDARARYYLGQAIRQMVERETLAKATTALIEYLQMGAPLGDEDGVREFLGSRAAPTSSSETLEPPG
ncbi:caspase family protein [Agromyces bracchium]|uniref:caspase family protein n=1 Tax=Agromyces bracchium TaxID=88376 RepID=UPI0012B6DC30|nr:caspase family protein [Agromyces bracchium]